jgi:hypothetical protein
LGGKDNSKYTGLNWSMHYSPKPHIFNSLPLQSSLVGDILKNDDELKTKYNSINELRQTIKYTDNEIQEVNRVIDLVGIYTIYIVI